MHKEKHNTLTKSILNEIILFCIFVTIYVGIAGGIIAFDRLVIHNEILEFVSLLGLIFIIPIWILKFKDGVVIFA